MIDFNLLIQGFQQGTLDEAGVKVQVQPAVKDLALHALWFASGGLGGALSGVFDKEEEAFKDGFVQAWVEMIVNLALWETSTLALTLPRSDRVLIVAWHFPELPKILAFAKQIRALLLVSQDAPWLASLKAAGCTLPFLTSSGPRELTSQMNAGRIVGAMMDHVHPDTKTVVAPLLGHQVRVPSGVLELSAANNYTLSFIGPRNGKIDIVKSIDAAGQSAKDLAVWVNNCLGAEVERARERWLMWPSMTHEK